MRLLPKGQDWTAYAYLIYFVPFLLYPFLNRAPVWQCAAALAATIAGAGLYLRSYWIRGTGVLWLAGAWFALAILFARINPGNGVFFIFGACVYGRAWEPPVAFRWLAGHLALTGLICWALRLELFVWGPSTVFGAFVGALVIQYSQRERLAGRLAEAHEESEHLAKVAERERIARDLHDLLGHTLSLIVLKSELASRLSASQPERAAEEIRDVERISRDALAQVRAAVRGYRSMGLESELKQARATLETAGIAVEASMEAPRLSPMQESVFALALREAVTNVVRHAQATFCRLTLRQNGGYCELEIADNGRGGCAQDGSGLSGMRERVESLGGMLERDGTQGTLLRIRVPV